MTNSTKSTKDAPPESPVGGTTAAPETAPYTAFAALLQKGVERMAEMQKVTLDMMASHTTDAISAVKQTYPTPGAMPGAFLLDLVDQGMGKMAEAQKGVIDLMVQQSTRAFDMTRERGESASKWTTGMADMLSEVSERTVAAQKILLEFAAEQNKVVAATVKRQTGVAGSTPATMAVDTLQRNVDVAIQTQKDFIEAAAKPLKATAAAAAAAPKQAA